MISTGGTTTHLADSMLQRRQFKNTAILYYIILYYIMLYRPHQFLYFLYMNQLNYFNGLIICNAFLFPYLSFSL